MTVLSLVVLVVSYVQVIDRPRLNITVLCQHLHLHTTASGLSAVLKPISSNVLSSVLNPLAVMCFHLSFWPDSNVAKMRQIEPVWEGCGAGLPDFQIISKKKKHF